MPRLLSAKEQPLSKIFSSDYLFTIPGYQRPYAWGTEQAEELLEDVLAASSAAGADLQDAAPYFLGSIVLIQKEGVPDATVVDGQQRLTTLTLLLSAIRATVKDAEVQTDISACIYQKPKVIQNLPASYRLTLRERDQAFFRQYIQHEGGLSQLQHISTQLPDAQARLKANAELFLERLQDLDDAQRVQLVQFIVTRCFLVVVATPDLDSAYRIFGVLNSRGLDLSATDILKAEITGAIAEARREDYTRQWEDFEESLGGDAFGELFSHIRTVFRKTKSKGTLLKEFADHVKPKANPVAFMDDVLFPMARAFKVMRDESYAATQLAEEINDSLGWLNRLEFTDWVPPALAFFVRHHSKPPALLAFLRDLERLAYSMLARKSGINERIERFSLLTTAIEVSADLHAANAPLQLTPQEQHETYEALNGPLYETHAPRVLAVLLQRLDQLLSDQSVTFKPANVSVEHVLPQQPAPRSQWLQWVSDPEVHQFWVHRLGNLALLSRNKNSAASNFEFDKKKTAYFQKGGVCLFALTTQVLTHAQWTAEVIEQRQQALLAKLEAHWRLQNRQSPEQHRATLQTQLALGGHGLVFELQSPKLGLHAKARVDGTQFTVLAGSLARKDWIGVEHNYQSLWQGLVDKGLLPLTPDGQRRYFTEDTVFNSASAASATVLGRASRGTAWWKLPNTLMSYGDLLDSAPPEQA